MSEVINKIPELFAEVKKTYKILRASVTALNDCERILADMDKELPPEGQTDWTEEQKEERLKKVDTIIDQFYKHRDFLITHSIDFVTYADYGSSRTNRKVMDSWYGPVAREIYSLINAEIKEMAEEIQNEKKD